MLTNCGSMVKEVPLLLPSQQNELKQALTQWALTNGLTMFPPNFDENVTAAAPVTFYPTPFPHTAFKTAIDVQKVFNELYIGVVSRHKTWLLEILETLAQFDQDFTGKLFEIYLKSLVDDKSVQPVSLGLFRSDYMVNQDDEVKQVEFNTVSVSFGGLSTKVGQVHRYLNQGGFYDNKYSSTYYDDDELPVSNSASELARGLAQGVKHYSLGNTVVLVIVQPGERNVFDQKHIEFNLLAEYGIRSVRMTLEEVQTKTTINQHKLYIKLTMDEVSVVYYRSGYAPSDYYNDQIWDARLYLEKNMAIKCPSVLTQLSGAKKVQQLLTQPEIIKSVLPDLVDADLEKLVSTFVKIYPLDESEEGTYAKKEALESPGKYVLKPQREGGGNNIYKEDIPDFLSKLNESEWGAYILMELIKPANHENVILRQGEIISDNIISELGTFGTALFNEDSGEIYENEYAGWLLRSKVSSSDEGGVAAGFGCVDSVYLF